MDEKKMCSICKEKPATLFFTKISSDNKKQNVDLCDACAKAKGVDADPTALLIADADVMLGLGAALEVEQAVGTDLKCPRCGFSQGDFKKSGRLGCPGCYVTFAEGLRGLLKTMHKGTRHTGKAPEALRSTRENADKLKTLQAKLTKAIKDENYEQAAQVRDEIKQLTGRPAPTASPK